MASALEEAAGLERTTPGAAFSDLLLDKTTVKGLKRVEVPPIDSLDQLHLNAELAKNVSAVIKSLTPVQRYAMPAIIRSVNVLGCSYTGSGKTAAFLVPVLDNILKQNGITKKGIRGLPAQPVGLVLVPTRELAIQIKEEAVKYCLNTPLTNSIHVVCGGKNMELELNRLSTMVCNLVVATVGRLQDLIQNGTIDLSQVQFFVLDEADVMMDKGFFFDVIRLAKSCSESCVSALFSATYPNAVRKAAESILRESYVEVQVGQDGPSASKTITQSFQLVERSEKDYLLKNVLEHRRSSKDKVLIFGGSIEDVDRIHQFLIDSNFSAGILHSGLGSQRQREFALNEFKRNNVNILVATSVAARGLDIPNVDLVLNYDLPKDIEEYILRIGRTGRVGNIGEAIAFFEYERDGPLADNLISSLRRTDQAVPPWLSKIKDHIQEDQERLFEAHDVGEYSNKTRIFNSYGSTIPGIPSCNEVVDDTWD